MDIDSVISVYIGKVVADKHHLQAALPEQRKTYEHALRQDTIVLGALRCAKANGYTGEK